jgi:DNA-binding MarR family transcriptional regulator
MGDTSLEAPQYGLHAALKRHTGFLINRIGAVARKGFAERLDSLGLNLRMWGVLNVLDEEGSITQHALGRCVGVDPSSMVSTIDELEARGLVERRRNPSDRRAHALHLTEAGSETLARGRALARQAQDELLAPLSAKERKQFHEMLLRIALAADAKQGESERVAVASKALAGSKAPAG